MSLITSCPNCGTMFRVVPDQLKISEGWVRCGHCSEVFDASAHLTDESLLVEPQTAQAAPKPTEPPARPPEPPAPAAREPEIPKRPAPAAEAPAPDPSTELPRRSALLREKAAGPAESAEPSDFFGDDNHSLLEPSPLDAPFVFRPSELTLRDSQLPEPGEESQMLPEDFGRRSDDDDEVPDVSFVRKARRKAFWRRPAVRIALAFTGLLLAFGLLLQIAYQDRDRLALAQPGLKPALERMCELAHCTLGPPRQIESIVIESSGFNRLRNDTYKLAFTLRNTAPVAVALPAMELTITDSQDQAITRRVLTPAELGADAGGTIPAAGEWSRTAGIVLAAGGSARVAGYRLLAFYP